MKIDDTAAEGVNMSCALLTRAMQQHEKMTSAERDDLHTKVYDLNKWMEKHGPSESKIGLLDKMHSRMNVCAGEAQGARRWIVAVEELHSRFHKGWNPDTGVWADD